MFQVAVELFRQDFSQGICTKGQWITGSGAKLICYPSMVKHVLELLVGVQAGHWRRILVQESTMLSFMRCSCWQQNKAHLKAVAHPTQHVQWPIASAACAANEQHAEKKVASIAMLWPLHVDQYHSCTECTSWCHRPAQLAPDLPGRWRCH